jgi:hypothetical protein
MDSQLIPMSIRIRSGADGAQIGIQPATSPLAPFKFIAYHARKGGPAESAASRELQSAATVAALLLPVLQSCQPMTA